MKTAQVQTLILRPPPGPAVAHLILCVPEGQGAKAAELLAAPRLATSFGQQPAAAEGPRVAIGFSFAGLEAMGLPTAYLRVFHRLAPAFREGAVRRSARLGDGGASAASRWQPEFAHDHAHVLISWHGERTRVADAAHAFATEWHQRLGGRHPPQALCGERLGAPDGQAGEWVHFGYRDGISEVCIDDEDPPPDAPDCRRHAPGALLLGCLNDAGVNPFVLAKASTKVRRFFHDSSFGILRPMAQNVKAFEAQIDVWADQLRCVGGKQVSRDFVKAKLCGRWPDGRVLRPGEFTPSGASLVLDLEADTTGQGCPFGSHVRRMRAAPDGRGHAYLRPLQRRSVPFGKATWLKPPRYSEPRGLIGQFFCASIEDQFEHLLGQWAAHAPLGFAADDTAPDPLIGAHEDPATALRLPLAGKATQSLSGFGAWTTTLGTMYAWHPGADALAALIKQDFEKDEDQGRWP